MSGIVFALFSSVFVATQGTELSSSPALTVLVVSVLLYELVAYVLLLLLVKKEKRASAPGFGRYLVEKPLTTLTMGLLATAVLTLRLSDYESAVALTLIFFIFLLGLRDIALAIFFAVENRGGWNGAFKDRLSSSKSWLLGRMVVIVIIAATAGVVW